MSGNLTEISSTFQFDNIVKSAGATQLVVVDFHAVWCGPCHAIAPTYASLAAKYPQAQFVKVDVDKQAQVAQRFGIRAMPTFKFLKGGKEVAELKGASPPQLTALVAQHAGPAVSSFSGSGQKLGSGPVPSSSSTEATPATAKDQTISLLPHVVSNGLTCLNESSSHPLSSIIGSSAGPKGTSYLESDVDSELLISIPFQDVVKLKSISIFSGVSPGQAPKEIKLFINHNSMDFSNAESNPPAQELTLSKDDVKGNKVDLRFVRFQNVRNLHILVKSNQDDEETTRIDSIDLFGTLGEENAFFASAFNFVTGLFTKRQDKAVEMSSEVSISKTEKQYPPIVKGASLMLAFQLKDRPVLLVGGGVVASGRLYFLLESGAKVTVVAPSPLDPLTEYRIKENPSDVIWYNRPYEGIDDPIKVDDFVMVMTAIDDNPMSELICKMARDKKIPVNIADVPPLCDFYFGAQTRKGPLQIMISTQGQGPRIGAMVRDIIVDALPKNVEECIEGVGNLRSDLRKRAPGVGGELGQKRMEWMIGMCNSWGLENMSQMRNENLRKQLLDKGWDKDQKVLSPEDVKAPSSINWKEVIKTGVLEGIFSSSFKAGIAVGACIAIAVMHKR